MSARRLRKVNYDGRKVTVRWEAPKRGDFDEHELACVDGPAPSLVEALKALRPHVAKICELPVSWCAVLEIRGVSCSYGGDADVMGATITALRHVATANAPLVLNTPHLPAEPYNENDETHTLDDETVIAIEHLAAEAFRYIDGHRAQVELFAGERGKVDPAPPPASDSAPLLKVHSNTPKRGRKS